LLFIHVGALVHYGGVCEHEERVLDDILFVCTRLLSQYVHDTSLITPIFKDRDHQSEKAQKNHSATLIDMSSKKRLMRIARCKICRQGFAEGSPWSVDSTLGKYKQFRHHRLETKHTNCRPLHVDRGQKLKGI
jgi:hypothetical protein